MSNELTIQDPNALALREEMNRRVDDRVRQLELADRSGASVGNTILTVPVSYTHLTLPTIYSV